MYQKKKVVKEEGCYTDNDALCYQSDSNEGLSESRGCVERRETSKLGLLSPKERGIQNCEIKQSYLNYF